MLCKIIGSTNNSALLTVAKTVNIGIHIFKCGYIPLLHVYNVHYISRCICVKVGMYSPARNSR